MLRRLYTLHIGDLGDNMKAFAERSTREQFRLLTDDLVKGLYSFISEILSNSELLTYIHIGYFMHEKCIGLTNLHT